MPEIHIIDRAEIVDSSLTDDGYMVVSAKVARSGIQLYKGSEVGFSDKQFVRVWRPESEVFHKDAMASYAHKPVTDNHPTKPVTSDTWSQVSVGHLDGEVVRDGSFVRVPLILMDAKAIKKLGEGKRELSAGYSTKIVDEQGVVPDGERDAGLEYDAVSRDIRVNHVAVVQHGRAGKEVGIGDGATPWGHGPIPHQPKEDPMPDNLRTVVVDGLSVSTTDQGAQAIERLQKDIRDRDVLLEQRAEEHVAAITAKDEQIGELTAKVKKLEDDRLSDSDLDARVAARANLVDTARSFIKDYDPAGKSDADIRKDVVVAKHGEEIVKDASDAEIVGMFRAVQSAGTGSSPHTPDPVRRAMQDRKPNDPSDNGQVAYEQRVQDAWKQEVA